MDNEATELLAELMPDEVDVESEVNELFVLLRPVDSEATLLLVVLSPLEREVIELLADESPVDVEVDSDVRLLLVVL
ncbi:hypothetical protein, partial [Burkholderia pseudomallei]